MNIFTMKYFNLIVSKVLQNVKGIKHIINFNIYIIFSYFCNR